MNSSKTHVTGGKKRTSAPRKPNTVPFIRKPTLKRKRKTVRAETNSKTLQTGSPGKDGVVGKGRATVETGGNISGKRKSVRSSGPSGGEQFQPRATVVEEKKK